MYVIWTIPVSDLRPARAGLPKTITFLLQVALGLQIQGGFVGDMSEIHRNTACLRSSLARDVSYHSTIDVMRVARRGCS